MIRTYPDDTIFDSEYKIKLEILCKSKWSELLDNEQDSEPVREMLREGMKVTYR